MSGENVVIDLSGVMNKEELLVFLGAQLKLGGTNGNHPVKAINADAGWGLNWDALADSFRYLGNGGIWGTSPKFKFPLTMRFINSGQLKANDLQSFKIFEGILLDTKNFYSREGQSFEYKVE